MQIANQWRTSESHNVNCPTNGFNVFKNSPLESALRTDKRHVPYAVAIREKLDSRRVGVVGEQMKINKHHRMAVHLQAARRMQKRRGELSHVPRFEPIIKCFPGAHRKHEAVGG